MKKALIFLVSFLLLSTNVAAKKQTYQQPVHLDDSGKPMVNSWQKNEEQRQLKKQVVNTQTTEGCKVLDNGQVDSNCKSQSGQVQKAIPLSDMTTPTSVIVNRPVQPVPVSEDSKTQ